MQGEMQQDYRSQARMSIDTHAPALVTIEDRPHSDAGSNHAVIAPGWGRMGASFAVDEAAANSAGYPLSNGKRGVETAAPIATGSTLLPPPSPSAPSAMGFLPPPSPSVASTALLSPPRPVLATPPRTTTSDGRFHDGNSIVSGGGSVGSGQRGRRGLVELLRAHHISARELLSP